jgi:type I restriction enzyme S subunit
LLSLKPEFAAAILSGRKRYEFRRTIFRRRGVTLAFIYSNSSVRRVVGAFEIGMVCEGSPQRLWDKYKHASGIDEPTFFSYFEGARVGYAIGISRVHPFTPSVDPQVALPGFVSPQSFYYLSPAQACALLPPGRRLDEIDGKMRAQRYVRDYESLGIASKPAVGQVTPVGPAL